MKRVHHSFVSILAVSFALLASFPTYASPPAHSTLNTTKIERLAGVKGHLNSEEQVFKLSMPRNDLKANANGVAINSAMGLTSWISFKKADDQTFLIGDLVLTPDQINAVMGVALNNDIKVTGLHNNYLWEHPQIVFMHIEASGNEDKLASAAGKIFAEIKATSDGHGDLPLAIMDPANTTLDPAKLNALLGHRGTLKDGVYKVIVGKSAETDEFTISSMTGLNSWAAFIGSNTEAVVNGDVVIEESNLQKILLSLHKAGIYVVGIQDYAADSEPKFVSVHFWGVGDTTNLAKGIKNALDLQ